MIWIGIDPGVHTGFAVWDSGKRRFIKVETLAIHEALDYVKELHSSNPSLCVVFEDARQRKWYGNCDTNAKQQGAGSIKRECGIWEDFLTDHAISFRAVAPGKGMTKMSSDYFKTITGWKGRTSNHARDAALLVFGR